MLNNYLKIAFRNLRGRKLFSFINVFGLAVGLSAGKAAPVASSSEKPPATRSLPTSVGDTDRQAAIRAWMDEHMVQRDFQIVEFAESRSGATCVRYDVTTPQTGTRRKILRFVFYTSGRVNTCCDWPYWPK